MRRLGWCIAVAACGRIGFDPTGRGAPGDGPGGDGSGIGADAGPPACGSTVKLADPFTATSWSQNASSGYMIAFAANRVDFMFPNSAAAGTGASLQQKTALDARGTCTTFELLGVTNPATTTATTGALVVGSNDVAWNCAENQLAALASATPIQTATYDPAIHRFLRIEEAGGAVYWSTSPDGATFAPFGNTALDSSAFPFAAALVTVGADAIQAATNAGTASWGPVVVTGP